MEKITIDILIDDWNELVDGYHKKVRVRSPFYDAKFKKLFLSAAKDLPEREQWQDIIKQTLKLFNGDPFWEERRGKQGLMWLFQRRSKGLGEINWIYYYELSMDEKEEGVQINSSIKEYFKI
jgi:hypothetical protein